MIHPDLAHEARRALGAWEAWCIRKDAGPMPDGWAALKDLLSAAARQPVEPEPDWLTLDQAATRANVSVSTLYRWRRRDGLPSQTIGGRVLISRRDLDQWIGQESPTSPEIGPAVGQERSPGGADAAA